MLILDSASVAQWIIEIFTFVLAILII